MMSALTDHHDRVRVAGVLALLLLACGLSVASLVVLSRLAASPSWPGEPRVAPPATGSAGGVVPHSTPLHAGYGRGAL